MRFFIRRSSFYFSPSRSLAECVLCSRIEENLMKKMVHLYRSTRQLNSCERISEWRGSFNRYHRKYSNFVCTILVVYEYLDRGVFHPVCTAAVLFFSMSGSWEGSEVPKLTNLNKPNPGISTVRSMWLNYINIARFPTRLPVRSWYIAKIS